MTGITAPVRPGWAVAPGWMTATAVLLTTSIGAVRVASLVVRLLDAVLVPHSFRPGHADLEEPILFTFYNCLITFSILA